MLNYFLINQYVASIFKSEKWDGNTPLIIIRNAPIIEIIEFFNYVDIIWIDFF